MASTSRFLLVNPSSIDVRDTTYVLSPVTESPDDDLRESIRTFGILYPPLLRERRADSFVIVSGRKRILTALEVQNADPVPCRVLPADSSDYFVYAALLEHSLIGGRLSIAQQTAFFTGLLRACSRKEALPLLAKLGYQPTEHKLAELLSLRNLALPVLIALHHGILAYNSARKMVRLPAADQETLVGMITKLHLGGSKQQKLIELCAELVMRRNEALRTILRPFFSRPDNEQPENIPQQSAALLKWLQNESFPRSSGAEKQFNTFARQLELPPHIRLQHSPAFEDETVTLCLSFPDRDSVREAWARIREIM